MVPCVILLALDKKTVDETSDDPTSNFTEYEMRAFGGLAVLFGILAPLFWTTKAYFLRRSIEQKSFKTWDVGIDHMLYQSAIQTLIYVTYLGSHAFELHLFLEGLLVGVFFLLGGIFATMAFQTGPGGPINAIITTQIIYQTVINAVAFGQDVSSYELAGIASGMSSTLLICLWDNIAQCCSKK